MNILYVSYHFPPRVNSTSMMNYNIVKKISEEHNVTVLTSIPPSNKDHNSEQLKEIKDNKNITVNFVEEGILHRKFNNKLSTHELESEKLNSKLRLIKKYLSKTVKLKNVFLIPDPVIDWYPDASKKLKKILLEEDIDIIFSSSTPYTDHLLSYSASKKYDRGLILLNADPWAYEQSRKRGFLRFNFEKKLESMIINRAKHVFVVTDTTRALYLNEYNIPNEKISTTTLGYDIEMFQDNIETKNNGLKRKMRMIYGGTLNPIHRNPMPFLSAISKMPEDTRFKIQVDFYIDEVEKYQNIVKQYKIDDCISVNPMKSYNEFIHECKNSDLLLLFGNSSPLQIPAKVFDYLAVQTPVVLIENTKNGTNNPTAEIIKSINNFVVLNNEVDLINKISEIYSIWNLSELPKNSFEITKKYQWSHTLKPIMDFLRIEENRLRRTKY